MKKILLIFLLVSCWHLENKSKQENDLTNFKKPEYIEISSLAVNIASEKLKMEESFFKACDSLIIELRINGLESPKSKEFDKYTEQELEKLLNLVKSKKEDIRKIQKRMLEIKSSSSVFSDDKFEMPEDNYLEDGVTSAGENLNNSIDYLKEFNEYFKEYKTNEEKEQVRKKILRSPKVKIPFSQFEKISEIAMKKLSDRYFKIIDIIKAKIILDNMDGKTFEERKLNFKKELPDLKKSVKELDNRLTNMFQGKVPNKKVEISKYDEINGELLALTFFPMQAITSFNLIGIAMEIQNTWREKGLMD